MTKHLKLIAIGNSTGVVISKDVLARLRLAQGDQMAMGETPSGFELTVSDAAFDAQMDVARQVMSSQPKALRERAK